MMMAPAQQPDPHAGHRRHTSPWMWGLIGGIGALSLAPYILPAIGIGSATDASNIGHFFGAPPDGGLGTGLAGGIQGVLSGIPLIGGALTSTAPVSVPLIGTVASGVLVSLAATAAIGIGGILLANWMEKREDPNAGGIRWSKIVRFAALATSALIALPGLLSALSIGITFLSTLIAPAGSALASDTALAMQGSLGATAHASGAGGIAAMLPHLFTCGAAALPVAGAMIASRHGGEPTTQVTTTERVSTLGSSQTPAHAH